MLFYSYFEIFGTAGIIIAVLLFLSGEEIILKLVNWISTAVLWIASYIVGLFVLFFSLDLIQRLIYVPKEYFFALHNSPLGRIVYFIVIIIAAAAATRLVKFIKTKDKDMAKEEIASSIKKYKAPISICGFLIMYMFITNLTVITNDNIKLYSPINPMGTQYSYTDIVSVNTGVYNKRIPFISDKGQFFYKVKFSDGKEINLMDLGELHNDFQYLDTYEEIEMMDEKIMKMGVSKVSSDKYLHLVDFDQRYIDRFQRILNNK